MKKFFLLLFIIFYLLVSFPASAAVLYSGSANQVVYENQTFVVEWFLDTQGKALNTVDFKFKYSKDTLEAIDASAGSSLLSLWIQQPRILEAEGAIELTGGVPNGFTGRSIPIFRTTFKAIRSGTGRIELDASSKVLKNDGTGASDTLNFSMIEFPIVSESLRLTTINSLTHPDQDKWYQNRKVIINFDAETGKEYSYSFSSNLDLLPDVRPDEVNKELIFENLPDGIYYFKISVKTQDSNWEEAGVYRIKIDATNPVSFTPEIFNESDKNFISFSTVDKMSGILHYKVKVGVFGRNKIVESPYNITRPIIGNTTVVEAYDQAGNVQTAKIEYPGLISLGLFKLTLVLIGFCSIILIFTKYLKNRKPTFR